MTDMKTSTHHQQPASDRSDGIVAQLARDDVERKKFLRMAGRGIGSAAAATGLAAFVAACGGSNTGTTAAKQKTKTTTMPASSDTDLQIVNYALTLEYLEDQFYAKVVASGLFKGTTLSLLKTFGEEEAEHVVALKAVAQKLGKPAAKPTGKFPIKSASAVATLAATVENLGAAAYLGQAPRIQSPEILAAALSIHTIEARHAATLNRLVKKSPTPDGAFAKPMSMRQVLAVVKPFVA